jgi:HK97 family phage portal protein
MPEFLKSVARFVTADQKDTAPVNRLEGFQANGAVVLRDRRGTAKAEIPEVTEKGFGGGDPLAIYKPTGAKAVSPQKAMASFNGWTFAAVNAIAREISNIQFRLYQVKGDDDHEELPDHPLMTLLDGVNERMTGIELKYVMAAHLELTGNCYLLLDGAKSDTDQPRALYPLNPGSVRVHLQKDVFPYKLDHYRFTIDNKVFRFEPYQILHIKYPDPNDAFVGIGFVQSIPSWIDSDNYLMEYNRKYFLNGAQIGLYIQTDTNVEGNIDRIRKGFENRQAGVENAHKVPVMPKGVKIEHTGVTHKDMDFPTLADVTRDRILAAAGVSKTILGTAESDTNRSTAETADYVFSKRTIRPKMLLIISYFNEFLVPRYGDDLYLTFIDPTPEDKAARTTEMAAAAGAGVPIMTQNEVRKNFMGLGPIDGGDQLLRPGNLVPSGTSDTPDGEDQTPQLAKSKTAAPQIAKSKTVDGWETKTVRVRPGGKTANSGAAQMRRALTEAFKKAIDKEPAYQFKSINELTHAEYEEHWKRFADRSEQAEAELQKIFRGINAKQREQVLENLDGATVDMLAFVANATKALDDLFDLKEWIGITINLATPILAGLTADEAASAFAMIGKPSQNILADESTQMALNRGISKMATSYNETTLDQLKTVLGEKLTQPGGTNLTELTEAVDGVYSYADEKRAALISKTESFRAANWANKEAWRASGVVQTVKWYTSEQDNVCDFCKAQEGKEIPIDQNFYEAGDPIGGDEGGVMTANYGDIECPPLHPLCNCYLRPESIE